MGPHVCVTWARAESKSRRERDMLVCVCVCAGAEARRSERRRARARDSLSCVSGSGKRTGRRSRNWTERATLFGGRAMRECSGAWSGLAMRCAAA